MSSEQVYESIKEHVTYARKFTDDVEWSCEDGTRTDMDFMCTADETDIRKRTNDTLQACMPGGGYCLGTGNTVANYVPLDHYLAMLDEGRRFA